MFRSLQLISFVALFFWTSFLPADEAVGTQDSSSETVATVEAANNEEDAEKGKDGEDDEQVELVEVTLAKGTLRLKQPAMWKAPKRPRSTIIEREFAIPHVKSDEQFGRLTMMQARGSVEANVSRWFGQFEQPDGKKTKDVAKIIEKEVNGQKVMIVDISGTFSERIGGGPFAPGKTVERENYRMLGGIVQTKDAGQYFFKLYGPKDTVDKAEQHYISMIESIEAVEKRSE